MTINLMTITTTSAKQTQSLAFKIGQAVLPGTVLACYGHLGAGKTTFAQGLAQGLEIDERVTSPTFMLIQEYCGRLPFYHLDTYRLEEEEEIYDLGIEDCFRDDSVTLVEWAERIEPLLPKDYIKLSLYRFYEDEQEVHQLKFEADFSQYPWLKEVLLSENFSD